jgi:hypothetical protein
MLVMTTNNRDSNKFIASEISARVGTRPKPIIRVRINSNSNSNSKAEADHDLILESLARLNGNVRSLEELLLELQGLISKLLNQQHYAAIRERERRW